MASAVTVIFGANSTQFQAELARMQAMTVASSRRMAATGHMVGTTGIVRESVVIGREAMMGRGIGRIIGSLTLLAQYINSASRATKQGAAASRLIADAYSDEAVKASVAAAAAMKKAEASAVAAEMDGFENEASIAAADANAAESATANAAAVALAKKAEAAEADAVAQEVNAAATTVSSSKMAMFATLALRLSLMILIVVEAIIILKELHAIFQKYTDVIKNARDYTREHTLAVWEEVAAMDKLQEASLKTTEAIHKMNVAKDRSVELAREAIDAFKAESEARAKLYDANVKGKLLDIEIAEKKGLITQKEATRQKAAIESQSVTDKAAAKQSELDKVAKMSSDAAAKAEQDKLDAQAAAQSASDKINKSPEGKRRAEMLATAEKDLSASKSAAEQARKDRDEYMPGANFGYNSTIAARIEGYSGVKEKEAALKLKADTLSNAASSAQIRADSLKRFMSPDEIAAATAMSVAGEKTGSALSLKETARKAGIAASINASNSPAEVAAELSDIQKKMTLDLTPSGDQKGYSLNSQQKIGAYAATAPVLLQQLMALRSIDNKVTPIHPPSNHPPGERKPQLGTQPARGTSRGTAGGGMEHWG